MSVGESIAEGLQTYNDYTDIADYAKTPICWCFDNNVMFIHSVNGYEYAIYPKVAPSRADAATMFRKLDYVLKHQD